MHRPSFLGFGTCLYGGRLAFVAGLSIVLFLALTPLLSNPFIVYAQNNTITGLVFQDYNADGFRNTSNTPTLPAIDPPVAGVVVTAYDVNDQLVGSAVTGAAAASNVLANPNTRPCFS